ncbi:MAG: hypothetical protein J2P28_02590, partial [Actinobacteria bacterium]|nr:hypothetical protein [Actinomycetota bacterium]
IALVTLAAFIYRKPFQHLFSAVGSGMIGLPERAEFDLASAAASLRANTVAAATAFPGVAAYRSARWARRNPGQAVRIGTAASGSGGVGIAAAAAAGLQSSGSPDGPPPLPATRAAAGSGAAADGSARRTSLADRLRVAMTTGSPPGGEPPRLNLPSRTARSERRR